MRFLLTLVPMLTFAGLTEAQIPKTPPKLTDAKIRTADKLGHGFFNRPPWIEVTTQKADEFLTSLGYLQGPPTLKLPEGAGSLQKSDAKENAAPTGKL